MLLSQKMPYLASPGTVQRVLEKIIEAQTPERFTIDFLGTKLGLKGGSARPIIPLLKRIGFLRDDGTPTELYRQFRSETTRGAAMAKALKIGYAEAFSRNEYAYELDRKNFGDLVNSISGAEKGNSTDSLTVSTFFNLKDYADFEALMTEAEAQNRESRLPAQGRDAQDHNCVEQTAQTDRELGINLSYTINLNLPETTNIEVFDAIFSSLRKNLLGKPNG